MCEYGVHRLKPEKVDLLHLHFFLRNLHSKFLYFPLKPSTLNCLTKQKKRVKKELKLPKLYAKTKKVTGLFEQTLVTYLTKHVIVNYL